MEAISNTVLGGRFVLGDAVGAGGMGTVYRARDRETGRDVAVKVIPGNHASEHQRFLQEAHTLVELSHPAIVSYVAHGIDDGQRFLAMEWLEGEDLADRLARRGLTVEETIALGRRAAAGLAAAHARGIVHRDVKPSNLLLVDGEPARTKVIDFGVARLASRAGITASGVVLGTAGYMAPEQARASREADARADVFALGCVLYECLTGRPAFTGDHVLAILAKVMLEASPRVSASRPNVPRGLDDLIARMLAKEPHERPANCQEVLSILEDLGGAVVEEQPRPVSLTPRPLTAGEQRFLSIVVVDFDVLSVTTQTVTPEQAESDLSQMHAIADRFEAKLTSLGEGTQVLSLATHGGATAQSARAATAALKLREAFPSARIALATGRAATSAGLPVGPVIDRATALIVTSAKDKTHVRIDEVTASLLGPHYRVKRERDLFLLLDDESSGDVVRPLLGRPTPCVGREKELALLEATLRESASEPVGRAVLVTATAGTGKSRLRQELVARAKKAGDLTVLTARADPVGAGSSLGIARRLVRAAAELHDRESPSAQHARLRARLAERVTGDALVRVVEFLGELAGAPTDDPSPQLRAARNDPRILSERMRGAFVEWLAAECAAQPVLVVIEDLHWGDLASVSYLADALRELSERPLMVLATARPEVHDAFPKLWAAEGVQEIRLGGLTKSASERLARAVLGDVPSATLARIVERADGNAFYLEELIRRVSEGETGDLPESVLAMVEARLSSLEPEARRALRAASVFGDRFWLGGVVALLGTEVNAADVASWMRILESRELLVLGRGTDFPGETEYVFRHGLLRDAAYGMLTEADRVAGHALAGAWLEAAGERDPLVLAEHFERGGELARAVPWLTRAALVAREGGSVQEALRLVERALVAKPEGEALGLLRALECECFAWTLDWRRCLESSRAAVALLPRHSPHWFLAVSATIYAGSTSGQIGAMQDIIDLDRDLNDSVPSSGPLALALAAMVLGLLLVSQRERAFEVADALEATGARRKDADPAFAGWHRLARGLRMLYGSDEPGLALVAVEEGEKLHRDTGDPIGVATALMLKAQTLIELGAYDTGIAVAVECAAYAEKRGLTFVRDWAETYRARALVRTGKADEALAVLGPLTGDTGDMYRHLIVRTLEAEAYLVRGQLDEAESRARAVYELDLPLPPVAASVRDVLARVALARGQSEQALALANSGLEHQAESGLPFVSSALLQTRLSALRALGRTDEACDEEQAIATRVARIATGTPDAYRGAFLALGVHQV